MHSAHRHQCHKGHRDNEADSQERNVSPADREAHLLVLADEASSIESYHEVSEGHHHDVLKDLELVEDSVQVGTRLTRLAGDLDHNHGGKADRAHLGDPLVAQDHHTEGEDELASQLRRWEVNGYLAPRLILVTNHSFVQATPGCPEVLVKN